MSDIERMARDYLTAGDLDGKIEVMHITCSKCPRRGRYRLSAVIARHGREVNMADWLADLKGDCPNRYSAALAERCDISCTDMVALPR